MHKLADWVAELGVTELLILGQAPDAIAAQVAGLTCEVRWHSNPLAPANFPARLIAFSSYSGGRPYRAVLNPEGLVAPDRTWNWSQLPDSDPMSRVPRALDALWPDATGSVMGASFAEGDYVKRTGTREIGRVVRVSQVGTDFQYVVATYNGNKTLSEASLEGIPGDPGDASFWLAGAPAGADSLTRTLTWTKLHNPLTDVIYSYRSSRTVFRAYQFRPVMKIINSDKRRLLIADEVGLGKTIEAGLVWNELEQRSGVRNVLVVCPSTLRFKWQREMRERFDRDLAVMTRADLESWAGQVEGGRNPEVQAIVSLELLRAADSILDRLRAMSPHLDLVIVDEAHYLRNRQTRSYELGELLAEWADALLFLSATPLNLHQEDLFNLLSLLDPEGFPSPQVLQEQVRPNAIINSAARALLTGLPGPVRAELMKLSATSPGDRWQQDPDFTQALEVVSSTDRLDAGQIAQVKRHLMELHTLAPIFSRTRKVDTTEDKAVREVRDKFVAWTPEEQRAYDIIRGEVVARALMTDQPVGFVTQMPLRQAASCLPAMQRKLAEKRLSQWSDEDEDLGDDAAPLDFWGQVHEQVALPDGLDSKYDIFLDALKEALAVGSGQALVFSYFKGTLTYLLDRLSRDLTGGARVALMFGDTPMAERESLMADFRAGRYTVLLCSEVGSEGLDFQFCNVVINYDLPWNPMRIEQRIGRVDRFGQPAEKVFIFNMQVPGTIETDILARLYRRIGVFEETIGELEPILRDLESQIQETLDPQLSDEQRATKERLLDVAIESRQKTLEELESTDSLLNGMSDLLVDGFDATSPGRGRFLGGDELRSFVAGFLARVGGRMRPITGTSSAFQVTGERPLEDELRRVSLGYRAQLNGPALAARVSDQGFTVAFDESEAVRQGLPLASVRHPLVIAAVNYFERDDVSLERYGVVGLPGLDPGSEYLVGVYLVEATGVRPTLELACFAVDALGDEVPGVGEQLLSALAHGAVEARDTSVGLPVHALFARVEELKAAEQSARDAAGRGANDALVDRRKAVQAREFELKLERARRTAGAVAASGRSEQVQRMWRSRVANLEARRDEVLARLEEQRGFSLSMQAVALVVVKS
jgi:superfamily II DNA or RNA helicase